VGCSGGCAGLATTAFEPAVSELCSLLTTRRAGNDQRTQREICRIALEEWLDDICRTCGGRSYTINKGVKHACSKCNATGTRRHSDAERMRRLGIDKKIYRKVEVRFAEAHNRIADADLQTARTVSRQLQ
jgi:DnaJ-class molecular chaperone